MAVSVTWQKGRLHDAFGLFEVDHGMVVEGDSRLGARFDVIQAGRLENEANTTASSDAKVGTSSRCHLPGARPSGTYDGIVT